MAFDPKKFLAEDDEIRSTRVKPKNDSVADEFGGAKQYLRNLAMAAPEELPISSAWRSEEANKSAGGVPNSYHKTGEALDVRKIGDQSKNLDHFRNSGMKVLDEGDHFHIEPAKGFKSTFDPKAFLRDKGVDLQEPGEVPEGSADPEVNIPESSLAGKHNPGWTFLRSFAKGGTAGLSEPLSAAIAAPIASMIAKRDPNLSVLPEEKKSLGGAYKSIRKKSAEEFEEQKKEAPGAALLGEISGFAAPGAAFSRGYGLAEKGLEKAAPAVAKNALGKAALTGGAANLGFGTIEKASDPNQDLSLAGAGIDFGLGAAGDAATIPLKAGGKKLYSSIKKQIDSRVLPAKVRGMFESIPGFGGWLKSGREAEERLASKAFNEAEAARKADWKKGVQDTQENYLAQEAQRRAAYDAEREAAQEAVKLLPAVDDAVAGEALGKAVKESERALSEGYRKASEPIMKRYGMKKASPEALRQDVSRVLRENGVLDETGNIIAGELDSVIAPNRKAFLSKLIDISEALQKNPSVQKLNKITQDLNSLANFGSASRSAEDKLFGKLAHTSKNSLMENLERVATEAEKSAPAFKKMRAELGSSVEGKQRAAQELSRLEGVKGSQEALNVPGQLADATEAEIKAAQAAKGQFEGKIDEAQSGLQDLTREAQFTGKTTAEEFRAARQRYAQVKPILDELGALTADAPEQAVKRAASKLQGSFIKEAMKNSPELRESLANVVLNNIVQRGTTPQSLSRTMETYGRDTLRNLLGDDTFKSLAAAEKKFHASKKSFKRNPRPKPDPFIPKQMDDPELAKIYQWLSNLGTSRSVGSRMSRAIGGAALNSPRYIGPSIGKGAEYRENF